MGYIISTEIASPIIKLLPLYDKIFPKTILPYLLFRYIQTVNDNGSTQINITELQSIISELSVIIPIFPPEVPPKEKVKHSLKIYDLFRQVLDSQYIPNISTILKYQDRYTEIVAQMYSILSDNITSYLSSYGLSHPFFYMVIPPVGFIDEYITPSNIRSVLYLYGLKLAFHNKISFDPKAFVEHLAQLDSELLYLYIISTPTFSTDPISNSAFWYRAGQSSVIELAQRFWGNKYHINLQDISEARMKAAYSLFRALNLATTAKVTDVDIKSQKHFLQSIFFTPFQHIKIDPTLGRIRKVISYNSRSRTAKPLNVFYFM